MWSTGINTVDPTSNKLDIFYKTLKKIWQILHEKLHEKDPKKNGNKCQKSVPKKETATEADPAFGAFFALKQASSYSEHNRAGQWGKPVNRAQIGPF